MSKGRRRKTEAGRTEERAGERKRGEGK